MKKTSWLPTQSSHAVKCHRSIKCTITALIIRPWQNKMRKRREQTSVFQFFSNKSVFMSFFVKNRHCWIFGYPGNFSMKRSVTSVNNALCLVSYFQNSRLFREFDHSKMAFTLFESLYWCDTFRNISWNMISQLKSYSFIPPSPPTILFRFILFGRVWKFLWYPCVHSLSTYPSSSSLVEVSSPTSPGSYIPHMNISCHVFKISLNRCLQRPNYWK